MDKQQIYDEKERLDAAVMQAASVAGDTCSADWFAAGGRAAAAQRADREKLHAACDASGGHVFKGRATCDICGAYKNAAANALARNLTVGP